MADMMRLLAIPRKSSAGLISSLAARNLETKVSAGPPMDPPVLREACFQPQPELPPPTLKVVLVPPSRGEILRLEDVHQRRLPASV